MCMACALLQTGGNIWIILAITPGVMAAHYSIEYRTHFTGVHYTVVGMIGATEQLCIFMTATLFCVFHPLNNGFCQQSVVIPYFDYTTTYGDLIWVFVGSSGYHWTTENFVRGFLAAKDKTYAVKILIPYFQFLIMMYISSYSRFYGTHTFCFIAINGLFLTYVTGVFNLNTTCGMTFRWRFIDPFFYAAIILLDAHSMIEDKTVVWLYVMWTCRVMMSYLMFMTSVI